MNTTNEIEINGATYIRKDHAPVPLLDGMPYVVIRSRDSGCHAGYLKEENGTTVVLVNARRLYYWDGAATLSQLAMEGVKVPKNCKFPQPVNEITVYGICEKIATTIEAQRNIQAVEEWKQ